MRSVFSSNDPSEIVLVRDALHHEGIGASVQNEYSGSSAVPEFRPAAEVWVDDEADLDRARAVVRRALQALDRRVEGPPWFCARCAEQNPPSFELCWNCGGVPAAQR